MAQFDLYKPKTPSATPLQRVERTALRTPREQRMAEGVQRPARGERTPREQRPVREQRTFERVGRPIRSAAHRSERMERAERLERPAQSERPERPAASRPARPQARARTRTQSNELPSWIMGGKAPARLRIPAALYDRWVTLSTRFSRQLEFVARHRLLVSILLALAIVLGMLWMPARNLYVAKRHQDVMAAQLTQLTSQNEALQQQNEALMTKEGIEDAARAMGFVPEGEEGAVVNGVSDDDQEQAAASLADVPWYIKVLDTVFGYSGQ